MITISDEIIDSYYQKGGAPAIKKYIEEIIKYKYEEKNYIKKYQGIILSLAAVSLIINIILSFILAAVS